MAAAVSPEGVSSFLATMANGIPFQVLHGLKASVVHRRIDGAQFSEIVNANAMDDFGVDHVTMQHLSRIRKAWQADFPDSVGIRRVAVAAGAPAGSPVTSALPGASSPVPSQQGRATPRMQQSPAVSPMPPTYRRPSLDYSGGSGGSAAVAAAVGQALSPRLQPMAMPEQAPMQPPMPAAPQQVMPPGAQIYQPPPQGAAAPAPYMQMYGVPTPPPPTVQYPSVSYGSPHVYGGQAYGYPPAPPPPAYHQGFVHPWYNHQPSGYSAPPLNPAQLVAATIDVLWRWLGFDRASALHRLREVLPAVICEELAMMLAVGHFTKPDSRRTSKVGPALFTGAPSDGHAPPLSARRTSVTMPSAAAPQHGSMQYAAHHQAPAVRADDIREVADHTVRRVSYSQASPRGVPVSSFPGGTQPSPAVAAPPAAAPVQPQHRAAESKDVAGGSSSSAATPPAPQARVSIPAQSKTESSALAALLSSSPAAQAPRASLSDQLRAQADAAAAGAAATAAAAAAMAADHERQLAAAAAAAVAANASAAAATADGESAGAVRNSVVVPGQQPQARPGSPRRSLMSPRASLTQTPLQQRRSITSPSPQQRQETPRPRLSSTSTSQRPPALVSAWIKDLPPSLLPDDMRSQLQVAVEAEGLDGDRFSKVLEDAGELAARGVSSPARAMKLRRAWGEVLREDACKKVIMESRQTAAAKAAMTPNKAVKMVI
eukprot:TRINITY_DN47550_c0_g1_i1.p1 TRINITY_DN47550_c0_g1~~TRINITY_DN47550_c0_g1_i1.p1  ORF type:complete len:742 (-),score=167.24 TRINITY_DN47550_c0_g1_i1:43-2184(-)